MALSEMLHAAGNKTDVVLGTPGAGTWKREWSEIFVGRQVRVTYDADEAGDNGSAKVGAGLTGVAKSIEYIHWPETLPTGYDVRDYWLAGIKLDPAKLLRRFTKLFKPEHRRGSVTPENKVEPSNFVNLPPEKRPPYKKVIRKLGEWNAIDVEMSNTLKLVLATCLSTQLEGPPIWLYLVGPSGAGKTVAVTTAKDSDRVVFQSSVRATSLVSGYQMQGGDPSVLAQVDQKTLIYKDATELLDMQAVALSEVNAVLRGAYDGYVERPFGNGVVRRYWLHFSLIMATTPSVYKYPSASLGDRFLKYRIRRTRGQDTDRIATAIRMSAGNHQFDTGEDKLQKETRALVTRYLSWNVSKFPVVPDWMLKRVAALVQLIGMLRTQVERDAYSGRLLYKPEAEYGTRLAKTVCKLIRALALVNGVPEGGEADRSSYELACRVAFDTATPFNLEIVEAITEYGNDATREQIQTSTKIPVTTLSRILEDLVEVKLVRRQKLDRDGATGRKAFVYSLPKKVRRLWEQANRHG